MSNEKNTAAWLSDATNKLRSEAAALIADLAAVEAKIATGLAKDGDPDKAVETLTPHYVKRDVLSARLARLREALFTAIVADARADYEAAVDAVSCVKAKQSALANLWRGQVRSDCKDTGASKVMQSDSKYWPRELRDAATEKAAAQARVGEAAQRMQAVDYAEHAAAKARDAAIPLGGWLGKSIFYNAAAALCPELGSMAPETAGTLVFGR